MNKKSLLLAAALCLAVVSLLFLKRSSRSEPAVERPAGDVGRDLQARVAALPKPALTNVPQLTSPSAKAPSGAGTPSPAPACLSEEALEPLRRAFVPPRFNEDPGLPRERQTLLSNRILIGPEKRYIPEGASGKQSPSPRNTTPFIVQFATPVSDASRKLLTDAGALVRGFFPNNAVLAELTPEALAALGSLAPVHTVAEFLPTDKLQPFLASLLAAYPPEARVRVTLQTLAPEDAEPVASAVRAASGTVEGVNAGSRWGIVQAVVPLASVRALAARGEVQWIEERPLVQHRNDQAAIPSHLNALPAWDRWGLTGKGQIVGHADTGLDTGDPATLHPDFQGRIRALIARGRAGDASDRDGHGTHTAGSILGSGAASGGQYRGMAYEAQLVHQSVVDEDGNFTGLPADLYPFYAESFGYGACIHSDSWGSSTYGAYDSDCRSTDLFAWDHPEHLAVFAAGNDGRDTNSDGVVEKGAVGSPASAKNVLTVGAAENDRAPGSGGYSSYSWGTAWPTRYPANPIKSDYLSYSATVAPVYRQGMAAFSSRGPTQDNRIKPDVVAPGTDVISTKSAVGYAVWRDLASNPRYCFGGGTSMSTPLVAGSAALMRQYAVERGGVTNPSAALLKAMLVGGARSLYPGQYGTNATQEIPAASPNTVEGWGQPDLESTVHPAGRMVRLYDRIATLAGATNSFDITVTANNSPLDIALAWIDYPATAGAGVTRVNDLDLLVIAPDGTALYPNGGTSRDTLNTVETLRLASATTGVYHVSVIGAAVPYSGGAAALYVRGCIDAPPVIVHTPLGSQISDFDPYPVSFQVQSLAPLTPGEAQLLWSAGTAAAPTGEWQGVAAAWVTNAAYQASIPAQAPGTYVHYYLQADAGTQIGRLPQGAPANFFSFYVDVATALVVEGAPERFGVVTPPYGTNIQIANISFPVAAPAQVLLSNGVRCACAGWTGTGDVPAASATNQALLTINQPSTLTWLWSREFALTNRYRLADTGELFGQTVAWYAENAVVASETAAEIGMVGTTPYAFCGWYVDGARWPDDTSTSVNPATGISMTSPRLAQGDYLPFWQDTDGDYLSDWWELRYFGSDTNVNAAAGSDPDSDSWTNQAEFLDNTDPNNAASFPTPPTVIVVPLAPFQSVRPAWTVSATITDNLSVESAYLLWREKDEADWHTDEMTWVEGNTYSGLLDPPSHGAERVDYYIYAADLLGFYYPEFGTFSPVYSVIGDYEDPWLAVTPEGFDVFELCNDATNSALSVANLAGPDMVWTARVAAAAAPFAATNAAWSHSGLNDVWCVTTNRTWNGDAVWYCGYPAMRAYPDGCHALLDTPPFTVGAGGGLLFRQWIKTESDADSEAHFWDGAVIRVSSDNGATFTLIEPAGGYPYQITENPDSPFPANHPCLAGNGEGWETLALDLAAYAGQSVIVRFEFGSDLYVTDEGWYIANVTPFSFDEPAPAWLIRNGAWGGTLPDTWSAPVAMTLDPASIDFDAEVSACIRIDSSDPTSRPLIPVTVRRGHRLFVAASGPGAAVASQTFLFRDAGATVTLQADPGNYLYSVTINGVPQPGIYDQTTQSKTLVIRHVTEDQHVIGWFTSRIWQLTVASLHSTASPAVGVHAFTNGALISASVLSPAPLGDSLRRECTGWTLTGHTPSAGPASQLTFSITNNATLTWSWAFSHRLLATASANGSVSPTEGWYRAGSTAVVTSYPSAYYHLFSWQGDTNNATPIDNRLMIVMYEPHTVTATFAPNLTPTHGVPEYWLAEYGWTQDFESAAEADADNDGMATWAEWRADTDPTNTLSLLTFSALNPTTNGWEFVWVGGNLRTQQVQRAGTPAGPWSGVYTNLPPTPVTNTLVLPNAGDSGFYRIHIP